MYTHNRLQTHIDPYEGEHIVTDGKPSVNAKLTNFRLDGKSVQNGIPTPESPVPIESVPSSFEITSCGKNLTPAKPLNVTMNAEYYRNTPLFFKPKPSTTYTVAWSYIKHSLSSSGASPTTGLGDTTYKLDIYSGVIYGNYAEPTGRIRIVFTTPETINDTYTLWIRFVRFGSLQSCNIDIFDIQLNEGNTNGEFTPYIGSTTTLNLIGAPNAPAEWVGQPISLMSLPDGTADEYRADEGVAIKRVKKLSIVSGTNPYEWSYSDASDTADPTNTLCTLSLYDTAEKHLTYKLNQSVLSSIAKGIYKLPVQKAYFWVNQTTNYTHIVLVVAKEDITNAGFNLDNAGGQSYINKIISDNGGGAINFLYPYAIPVTIPVVQQPTPKSVYAQPNNIFTSANPAPTISCGVRKLGNRPYIQAKLKDELGNFLVDENGNNIGGLY